jgi:type IV secretory pathway component VirB8
LIPKEETDCTTESTENTENDKRCFFEKKKTLFFSVFSVLSVVKAVAVFSIAAPA